MRCDQQTMPMKNICVSCGATLLPSVSGGQCPKCLLRLAWSAHPEEAASEGQETSRGPKPATSPAIESERLFGDYELGSEDSVEVQVWKNPDLSRTVTVRPDGKISLPLVASTTVVGQKAGRPQSVYLGLNARI